MPAHKLLYFASPASLLCLALALQPLQATALEWYAEPAVTVGANVNDNYDLVPESKGTVWSTSVSPRLTLGASSALSTLSGVAQLTRLDYSEDTALSRTDGLLNLFFTRNYERSQLSLNGNLTRDSSLESELLRTGIVTREAQRTSKSLAPSWAYSINERDVINFGYTYNDVSYKNTSTTSGLLDYTEKNPTITLSHAFSEKNKINLALGYSDYQSQTPVSLNNNKYQFTTTSAQVGFSRELSETMMVTLMAGMHKTDSTISFVDCLPEFLPAVCFPKPEPGETDNSTTGTLFRATLQKALESSQITAELSRSLQATGDGGLVQTDQFSGGYQVNLAPNLTGTFNMSINQATYDETSRVSNDRRYYSIIPSLSWRLTERWTATSSYSRSVSKETNRDEAASNAINLTLNYGWPKISRSR